MAQIGRWSGHIFEVSPAAIKSFNELQVKIGSETDAKTENSQQYLTRKNWKPIEVSLTVRLHAGLGYDVRSEANAFVTTALSDIAADYFYVGQKKLVSCRLMLTEATISKIQISPKGRWTSAELSLVLKQAALLDGTQSGDGGGGNPDGGKKILVDPDKDSTEKQPAALLTEELKERVADALEEIKKIKDTGKQATVAGGGGKTKTAMTK